MYVCTMVFYCLTFSSSLVCPVEYVIHFYINNHDFAWSNCFFFAWSGMGRLQDTSGHPGLAWRQNIPLYRAFCTRCQSYTGIYPLVYIRKLLPYGILWYRSQGCPGFDTDMDTPLDMVFWQWWMPIIVLRCDAHREYQKICSRCFQWHMWELREIQ